MDKTQLGGPVFPALSHAIFTGGTFVSQTQNICSQSGGTCGYERLLQAVASNALYNSGHIFDPPKCHPGTRVVVIETILNWVNGEQEEIQQKDITWLSGAAGAGKSAIGRTVCERCADKGALLASFFFSAGDSTRNHSGSLAATIAYQTCAMNPAIRNTVSAVIDHNPLIFKQSLRTQLLSLVIDPLAAIYAKTPQRAPLLIVIDGLDECLDKDSQRNILETLLFVVTASRIPIRVLICSRPESQITSTFDTARTTPAVFKIFLGDEYLPDEDIRLYLNDRFAEIRQSHNLRALIPESWPTRDSIDRMIDKASGQFIFAATVMRYLESSRHRPHQRLEAALGIRPPFKDLPFAELDALYMHIILMADDPALAVDVLAYPAIYGSTPLCDIEKYLCLETGDGQIVLTDLASIAQILVRPSEGSYPRVRVVSLLHKSFSDFLFDSDRSKSFYKNRADTRAWHILRVIQVFSETKTYTSWPESVDYALTLAEHRYSEWKVSDRKDLLTAISRFPWDSFFRAITSQPTIEPFPTDYIALQNEYTNTTDNFSQHTEAITKCILSELYTKYNNHWKMNYVFATNYILRCPREHLPDDTCFGLILGHLSRKHDVGHISFRVSNAEKLVILSKAATHCLDYICDRSHTREEADRHLQIGRKATTKRRTRPWRWHLQSARYALETRRVTFLTGSRKYSTLTYGELTSEYITQCFGIYALESFDWARKPKPRDAASEDDDEDMYAYDWFRYMTLLEDLCLYLPLAARYAPLIQLCKTKTFAPMSMMFPALSRRARRSITQYLERIEAWDNIIPHHL